MNLSQWPLTRIQRKFNIDHAITYRIAVGPQQGRKVFTLQTLPPDEDSPGGSDRVAKEAGFSLHAGVSTEAHQRDKLWKVLLLRIPACGVREAPGTDYEWQRQL